MIQEGSHLQLGQQHQLDLFHQGDHEHPKCKGHANDHVVVIIVTNVKYLHETNYFYLFSESASRCTSEQS